MTVKELQIGEKAPEFSLPDQHGRMVRLADFRGTQVVLYFYPKDDTPGCTKEACGFRDACSSIRAAGAIVLGVSRDRRASHQTFIQKYGLLFSLLSDEDATVCRSYGVYKQKTMYGRKVWGIERSTFVIDGKGALKAAFRRVKVDGHVGEVLAVLEQHV